MPNKKSVITISGQVFLLYAVFFLMVPIGWVTGWIVAATIHELGHIFALTMLKIHIHGIRVGISGTRIITEPMDNFTEALCTLAGPLTGLLFGLLLKQWPYIAVSGIIHSLFNLIPVFPLDGGRVLLCLFQSIFAIGTARKISVIFNTLIVAIFFLGGVWFAVRFEMGVLPIIFPTVPILCSMRKNSLQRTKKNSTILRRTILRG